MDFQEAVRKAIKQYFAGIEPSGYRKVAGGRSNKNTRNKKYFDQMAEDVKSMEPENGETQTHEKGESKTVEMTEDD